jgi:hypothetical protein
MAAQDPPYRVARLNYTSGSVSLQPAGVDDWTAASINRPLTTGDRLYTDDGSRAELHIGTIALRLDGGTSVSFLNLDDRTVQIQLNEGTLGLRVRSVGEQDTIEVDTPNLAVSVLRPGEYRVDTAENGDSTSVTVRAGEGEVTGGGQAFTVHASEQAQSSGADSRNYELTNAPPRDGFDNWTETRDAREDRAQSPRYVPREMIGYEDLDDYGRWTVVAGYGPVWTPIGLNPDWAPYRHGYWVWIAPWGWTWVDDTPWGFAPFHYGRWAFVGNGWVWVPGPVVVRPVYSPALVAFVGGQNFGVALSFGAGEGVGWFPLAPGEPYVPAYRASPAYLGSVNNTTVSNTTINNITVNNYHYANQTVPGAVTAVPTQTFVSAKPVAVSAVNVTPAAVQAAKVVPAAPVAPVKTSIMGPATNAPSVPTPPAAVVSRQVVARTVPPSPPVPFAKQQQALGAQPGRPLDAEAVRRIQPPAGPRTAAHSAVKMAPPASAATNKPFVVPTHPAATPRATPSTPPAAPPQPTSSSAKPTSPPKSAATPPKPPSSTPPAPPPKTPLASQPPASAPPPRSTSEPKQASPPKQQEKKQQPSEPKPPCSKLWAAGKGICGPGADNS